MNGPILSLESIVVFFSLLHEGFTDIMAGQLRLTLISVISKMT